MLDRTTLMKQTLILTISMLLLICGSTIYAQTIDSTNNAISSTQVDTLTKTDHSADIDESDDFSPGLLFFALIGFAFILASVGCGIVLTILALLIISGLISFGILSTSILVGLNKKSFATGFKTFIVLTSTIGGLLLGGTCFWLLNKVLHWWTVKTAIIIGGTCGLLSGLLFGILTFYILQRLTNYIKEKLNITDN